MSQKQRLDIVLWAHSDQAGGTEIPCVLASAFLRRTGFKIRCGIVTPFPDNAVEFFRLEGGFKHCIEVIEGPMLLSLTKDKDRGCVDPKMTLEEVTRVIHTQGAISSKLSVEEIEEIKTRKQRHLTRDDAHDSFKNTVERCKHLVKDKIYLGATLFVSCGESVAIKVAKELNCRSVVVTDHLTTVSVRDVCTSASCSYLEDYSDECIKAERLADAVYLLPPEFGVRKYREHFSKNNPDINVMETSGLLYNSIPEHELAAAPHYTDLRKVNEKSPLVIVFSGGGRVWDNFIIKLHDAVEENKGGIDGLSLLLKDIYEKDAGGKKSRVVSKRTWKLYAPGESPRKLKDPGSLMYWYAACTLLVGRGGLAAQQIIASVLARPEDPPAMLFVDEKGHPQINSEWQQLKDMGLVHSIGYDDFAEVPNPLEFINNYLGEKKKNERQRFRRRATVRYCVGAVDRLADAILGERKMPSASIRTESASRFDDGREFLEILGDSIHFDDLRDTPRPLQLEIILASDASKDALDTAKKIIVAFKERVRTVVFSGCVQNEYPQVPMSDILELPRIAELIDTARAGTNVNIGIVSPLWSNIGDKAYKALVTDSTPGDYLNVPLDAGTQKTYEKRLPKRNWQQVYQNLSKLADEPRWLAIQLLYGVRKDKTRDKDKTWDKDLEGAMRLVCDHPSFSLVFSVEHSCKDSFQDDVERVKGRLPPNTTGIIDVIERRKWSGSEFDHCISRLFFPTVVVDNTGVRFYACPELARKQAGPDIADPQVGDSFENWKRSPFWKDPGDLLQKCKRECSQRHGAVNVLADGMLTQFRMHG